MDPQTRKVTDANPYITELLGFQRGELVGRELWQIGLLKDEDASRAAFLELQKNSFVRYEDLPLESKTGQRREVEFVSNIYDENGRDVIQCNIRDITERKKAEAEIKSLTTNLEETVAARTSELKAANEELEAFSYSVSHDLRAPLRAIGGFTRMLEKSLPGDVTEATRKHMERIRANVRKMGELIDGLLNFSSLGRRSLSKIQLAPSEVARAVLLDLHPEIDETRVRVEIAEMPVCQADETLLNQVFANLICNALKYSRDRHPAIVNVGSFQEKDETVYFVRDNGAGFEMKYAERLFHVFQRLHRADQFEGTGIGLAIVQRIIHRHGGRIWAEAELDRGATFYFTLGAD